MATTLRPTLVGGVLMGRNLIRNADLQAVVTDATRYRSAASQFQDKYLALPGDFNGATAMWGAADATLATCVVTASTGTATPLSLRSLPFCAAAWSSAAW